MGIHHYIFPKKKWIRITLFMVAVLLVIYIFCLPQKICDFPTSTVIYDTDSTLLGAKLAEDGQWRFPVQGRVPYKFKTAILTFEDKRFENHWGVDLLALGRAIVQNVRAGKIQSGASTITMQTIRISRKNPKRTLWEKFREIVLSTRLEWRFTKDEILALYAANAPFGGNIVGIDAAAWRYFGTNPSQLTWAESCMLAVLPNNPSMVHVEKNRGRLLEKRNRLLDKLYKKEYLDSLTCLLSKQEPLPDKIYSLPRITPHLLEEYHQTSETKGQRLYTHIHVYKQQGLNDLLERHYQQLKNNSIHNAAAIIIDHTTNQVIAYAGNIPNIQKEHSPDVDLIHAKRSSGSILKPFLYAAMLHDAMICSNTIFPDIPSYFGSYTPQNFDKTYAGAVPAGRMVSRSLNVPAVYMLRKYGINRFSDLLKRIGITTLHRPAKDYGLSLILGGAETTLWDLCTSYAGMCKNLGQFNALSGSYADNSFEPPRIIKKEPSKANVVAQTPLRASAIWHTFEKMKKLNRPEIEMNWEQFPSSQQVAWKTGTSFGFRDAWAIGCTPKYVVGVWVGNADGEGRPGLVGALAAAPILFDIFNFLPQSDQWFDLPYDEMEEVSICTRSGHLAGLHCKDTKDIWECHSSTNTEPCPYHHRVALSQNGQYRVNSACESTYDMQFESFFILPPSMQWHYQKLDPSFRSCPPYRSDCSASNTIDADAIQFVYPKDGIEIYIPKNLDATRSMVVFEVKHRNEDSAIFWHLNNQYMGTTYGSHTLECQPISGEHILKVIDQSGYNRSVRFTVK